MLANEPRDFPSTSETLTRANSADQQEAKLKIIIHTAGRKGQTHTKEEEKTKTTMERQARGERKEDNNPGRN